MINVDFILQTLNDFGVQYMLIGGMNYAIRHVPYITEDVDLWIDDTDDNRAACEAALAELQAEWGKRDEDWEAVKRKSPGWLNQQGVYSLYSPHGAIDIFRSVAGHESWQACFERSIAEQTHAGTKYQGLSDADMLQCQLALEVFLQKADRIATLKSKLNQTEGKP